MFVRLAASAAFAVALAGCGMVEPKGGPSSDAYFEGLRSGYTAVADSKREILDLENVDLFQHRANAAAAGESVEPFDPSRWPTLPAGQAGALSDARARLGQAYQGGARQRRPAEAAEAQVAYDCWVERAAGSWRRPYSDGCRNRFEAAVQKLKPVVTTHLVFFGHNRATIAPAQQERVRAAAADAKGAPAGGVSIVGNADRTGSPDYNMTLSRRRADAVADQMRREGATLDGARISGAGDANPRKPTPRGVREPENRNVEVTIEK